MIKSKPERRAGPLAQRARTSPRAVAGASGTQRVVERDLAGLQATAGLARDIARLARRGDVIGLTGDLGAGKTTFARAFIHAWSSRHGGGEAEEVPSPTFTLVQIYDGGPAPVWHFDLYRLAKAEEAFELGIEEAFGEGVSLIEWPELLGPLLPANYLELRLTFGALPEARRARLTGRGTWAGLIKELGADG